MGVLAESMREILAAMKANEEHERRLLTHNLNEIIQQVDELAKMNQELIDSIDD
jgi:ABC-type sulfate/molybdate transport systems ATPase subunit